MSVKWKTWATMLLILAGAGVAGAGTTLNLTFKGDKPALTGTIADTSGGGALNGTFWVGQSNFELLLPQAPDAGSDAAGLLALVNPGHAVTGTLTFFGYCIDTYQTIGVPKTADWTVVDINAHPELAPTVVSAAKVNLLKALFDYLPLAIASADGAAAMGAAVWEIINEGTVTVPYSLSTGDFKVTGGTGGTTAWAMANGWLLNLAPLVNDKQMYALVSTSTQDFVIPVGGVGSTVPEPFTMLTASLAIGGLGMYVRRRSGRSGLAG